MEVEDEAAQPRQLLFLGHCSVLHTGSHCGQQVGFLRCFCAVVACIHIIACPRMQHAVCARRRTRRRLNQVTHLLFPLLVFDDPILERKLSLSRFKFSYFQAFLQAFLQAENRSQQVGRLTLILYPCCQNLGSGF